MPIVPPSGAPLMAAFGGCSCNVCLRNICCSLYILWKMPKGQLQLKLLSVTNLIGAFYLVLNFCCAEGCMKLVNGRQSLPTCVMF